jgi:large subunit ribosomal protein L30
MSDVKTLRLTLVRSTIGYADKQERIVKSLGLRKLQSSVIVKDTPSIRGQINKVSHLLRVEEVDEQGEVK